MKNKWILLPVAAALLLTSCQSASGAAVYRNNPLELAQRVGQTVQKSTEIHLSADFAEPTPQESLSACLHYIAANQERYLSYQSAHPEMSPWDVVTYVNIGLDHPFYTNIQTVSDPAGLLALCNKYWKLPDGYEPSDLRPLSSRVAVGVSNQMRSEAAGAFEQLCADAKKRGIHYPGAIRLPQLCPAEIPLFSIRRPGRDGGRRRLQLARRPFRTTKRAWWWTSKTPRSPTTALARRRSTNGRRTISINTGLSSTILRGNRRSPAIRRRNGTGAMWGKRRRRKSTALASPWTNIARSSWLTRAAVSPL